VILTNKFMQLLTSFVITPYFKLRLIIFIFMLPQKLVIQTD